MRPSPKPRHLVAVAIFLVIGSLAYLAALSEDRMTDEQVNRSVNALRAADPGLYAADPVFGESGLWRFNNPLWQWYLKEVYRVAGTDNLLKPLQLLTGPVVVVYLLGMYALLWRQCRSWTVSCYVAVLSLAIISVVGGSQWGLGTVGSMTPEALCVAMAPLLLRAFLDRIDSPAVLWVFAAAGLLANINVPTGINLALVFAIVLLGRRKFGLRGWALAISGGLVTVAAASPHLWHFLTQRRAFATAASVADWESVALAFRRGRLTVLFPDLVGNLLEMPGLAFLLALWIPAVAVMTQSGRFRVRDRATWIWMLAGCLAVGLVLHGASQSWGKVTGSAPPVIDFVKALSLTLPALYVLLAQGIVHLLRLGFGRAWVQLTLGVVLVLWLTPAANLAVPRHYVEEKMASLVDEDNRPVNVQRRLARRARRAELRAIAEWLGENISPDDIVACQDSRVRLWSRRSLVACSSDVKFFYYMAPHKLRAWSDLVAEQRETLQPRTGQPVDPAKIDAFARGHNVRYAVLPPGRELPVTDGFTEVKSDDSAWGRHWRLCRIPPQQP